MLGIVGYGSFLISSVALNLTPGADTIYILSRSAVGGRKKGIVSALGISTGILIHTLLAAFGLSALLASSEVAFNIMKTLGAAYLIFMGIKTLISKKSVLSPLENSVESLLLTYRQGVLTNALNPKVALFFLALLPQFVAADNSYGVLPFLILGLSFFTTSTVWSLILAFISSFIAKLLGRSDKAKTLAGKSAGLIYILIGLNIFAAKRV